MFTLKIPCKTYVRKYLVNNFGEPADLSKSNRMRLLFRDKLKRQCQRYENREISYQYYNAEIEIIIPQDVFYRYGWEMTKTGIREFNSEIEADAKKQMRETIQRFKLIMPEKDAIIKFQADFNYNEDDWAFDAIKKDIQRNTPRRPNIIKEILHEINNKLW